MLTLQGWARDGLTDEQIAKNIGIAYGTLYEWKKRFPELDDAIKKGKAPVDFEVENALLKRALGYDWEEVTEEVTQVPVTTKSKDGQTVIETKTEKHIRKVKKHVPADVTAQIYWLKNRRRGVWCDRPPEIDNTESGENDGFIEALTATAAEDWVDES